MKIYLYGKIMHVNTNYLILDHNGECELIYVADIKRFNKDDLRKIFIYDVVNEYKKTTYGFENFKELIIFEDLISLQGLGPKTAISLLNLGWENLIQLIANEDKDKLCEASYVSLRIANNIIFAYKQKYAKFLSKLSDEDLLKIKSKNTSDSLREKFEYTMRMLGFKKQQISYALEKMSITENIEESVENAIKIIGMKQNESRVLDQ
ncbi:Holliday junction branch migration protein RuvA [Metamycoplasma hominis]|uniref:Holliday junction branch migration protein RuvA n=1 Tax=Metamycoplasma hominis TaxID=2098 RepID=UPI0034A4C6EF